MKRNLLTFVSFVLLFVSASAFAMDATVSSVTGKVEVQKNGAWLPVKAGDKLPQGSVVQTGFKSELVLKIKESEVKVAPLTRVTIEQLAEKEEKDETSLFVDTGSVKSSVNKAGGRKTGFTVRSPVATASVRGTEFSVANSFDGTQVSVDKGYVATWPSKNIVNVLNNLNKKDQTNKNGNSPEAITGGNTPAGSFTVAHDQEVYISGLGVSDDAHTNAIKQSSDLGGLTDNAAHNEREDYMDTQSNVGNYGSVILTFAEDRN